MKKKLVIFALFIILGLIICSTVRDNQKKNEFSAMDSFEQQDPDMIVIKPDHGIEICGGELLAELQNPYSGPFWEGEEHEQVSNIYYVKFTNCTDFIIESAEFILGDDKSELLFLVDILKPGESVFVAEANKTIATTENLRYVDSYIKYMEENSVISDLVGISVVDNHALKMCNNCGDLLRLVKIYYAPFDNENKRISGVAYTTIIDGIEANQDIEVEIEDWQNTYQVICVTAKNE